VDLHVVPQVAGCGKGFWATLALVGLLLKKKEKTPLKQPCFCIHK
jgi:hypothetical protein